jgi:hypothetical protein
MSCGRQGCTATTTQTSSWTWWHGEGGGCCCCCCCWALLACTSRGSIGHSQGRQKLQLVLVCKNTSALRIRERAYVHSRSATPYLVLEQVQHVTAEHLTAPTSKSQGAAY